MQAQQVGEPRSWFRITTTNENRMSTCSNISRAFGLALILGGLSLANAAKIQAEDFQLVDGDRVVLIGGTLVERDTRDGYLETRLTARWPRHNITFRNLGWSGDTVWGDARAGFDTRAEGFGRLIDRTREAEPTWIFVAYGGNESFDGAARLPAFIEGLRRLLDALNPLGAKIVLFTPTRREAIPGMKAPPVDAANQSLKLYAEAIAQVAAERGHRLLDVGDFVTPTRIESNGEKLTDNGLHFTPRGYWQFAETVERQLGLSPCDWQVELTAAGEVVAERRTRISDIEPCDAGLKFTATDATLPVPAMPAASDAGVRRALAISGLPEGRYDLKIDGQTVATATATEWAAGVKIDRGPQFDQVAALRAAIGRKNALFFHRWRPQNETYLLGFRKYEQGNNAVEIAQFDPLVVEQEAIIARLRVPVLHRYELSRTQSPPVEAQVER